MQSDLGGPKRLGELLRGLPQDSQPPYEFSEFTRRLERGRRSERSQVLAATTVVAVAVIALSLRFAATLPSGGGIVQLPTRTVDPAAVAPANSVPVPHDPAVLQEPALARVGTRAAVMRLEDRIAQLDDLLSAAQAANDAPPAVLALQQERSRVFGTLLQVRSAETVADESL